MKSIYFIKRGALNLEFTDNSFQNMLATPHVVFYDVKKLLLQRIPSHPTYLQSADMNIYSDKCSYVQKAEGRLCQLLEELIPSLEELSKEPSQISRLNSVSTCI